jgi:hypothetical protein
MWNNWRGVKRRVDKCHIMRNFKTLYSLKNIEILSNKRGNDGQGMHVAFVKKMIS